MQLMGHSAHESHDLAHHHALKANVIMGIVVVILLLTLAFENGHHWLMHKYDHDKYVKQFVAAFYRVLTVLGLIGLSLFTLIYFGFAKYINDRVFGESAVELVAEHELAEEGESINFAPTEFAEIVEDIQTSIFIAMCLYVMVGLGFTLCLRWQRQTWQKFDKMSFSTLKMHLADSKDSLPLLRYWTHKVRFMYPPSSLHYTTRYSPMEDDDFSDEDLQDRRYNETPPPPLKHNEHSHDAAKLDPKMIFSRYLTICYADAVTKIVRLSPSVWLATLATLLLGLPFYHDKILITYITIGMSLFILVLTGLIAERLRIGVEQITVPLGPTREAILLSETQTQARLTMAQGTLLEAGDIVVRTDNHFFAQFLRLAEGSNVRGAQDNLLMFGRLGKQYMMRLFQVILFIQVALITFSLTRLFNPWWTKALATGNILPELKDSSSRLNAFRAYCLLAVPALICIANISLFWPALLKNFTLLTNLENMINFELIDEIDTEIATQNRNDRDELVNALHSLSVLRIDDTSTLPNSGDLSDDRLFYALPDRLRNQLIALHKQIVLQEIRRGSSDIDRGGCTGAEAAALLNVPSSFTRIFEHAADLKEKDFIRKILAVAYSSASSDDEQTRADYRREVAARLFDQLDDDHDGFISFRDLENLVPDHSRIAKQWWTTEIGTLASYTDRQTFIEIFSAILAGVLTRGRSTVSHA